MIKKSIPFPVFFLLLGYISYAQNIELDLLHTVGEDQFYSWIYTMEATSEGDVLIADRGKSTIDQFSPKGEFLGTVAHPGNGPGEITPPIGMHSFNDTLLVQKPEAGMYSYYTRTGGIQFEYSHSVVSRDQNRTISIVGVRSNSTYWGIDRTYISTGKRYYNVPILITDRSMQIIEETPHTLRRPDIFFVQAYPDGGMPLGGFIFTSMDGFGVLENGRYIISRPDSAQLHIHSSDHRLLKKIQLDIERQPVTEDDWPNLLQDAWIEKLKPHFPEYKPAFRRFGTSSDHILLHLGIIGESNRYLVTSFEGDPVGQFDLPGHESVSGFQDGKLYTIYRDPDEGDHVRVYTISISE